MAVARALLVALAVLATPALAGGAPEREAPGPAAQAWALDWGHHAGAKGGARADRIACPMGDADRDGARDLLVQARLGAGGSRLSALAGPLFDRVLWSRAHEGEAALACAPDLQGDRIADPLLASPTGTGPMLALDGATGRPLLELATPEGSEARLTAAAPSLLLHVREPTPLASVALPPVASVSIGRAATVIETIGVDGEVLGTIEPRGAVLAYGVVRDAARTRVLVLTAVQASPVVGAPTLIPTTSAFDATGDLLWSVEHEATSGLPVLVPQAGDVDGDGVVDLIVETLPAAAHPGALVLLLSGDDGTLLVQESVDAGVAMALPFGDVARGPIASVVGDAVLLVRQTAPAGPIVLEPIVDGKIAWSARVDPASAPVNLALDVFTGDPTGFLDVTGDGVADVAILVDLGDRARLDVLSGRDGSLAWSRSVPPGSRVTPVPGHDGAWDLVVVDRDGGTMDLTRLDGGTGEPSWSAGGAAPPGDDDADVQTDALGDDGTEDLLVTTGDEHPGVYVLDGATGATRWVGSADADRPAPPPLGASDPQARDEERAGGGPAGPAVAIAMGGGLVAAIAGLALRRYRAD